MTAFDKAFLWMIPHEGGYVNDPDDPGGETNFGIAKKFHPDVDIKNLTLDQAKAIYREEYWDRMHLNMLGEVAPRVAAKVFDTGVNAGTMRGCKFLQNALNLLEVDTSTWILEDGIIGPKTIAKVVKFGEDAVLAKYCKVQLGYYVSLDKPKYIKGWTRRALDIPGEDDV